MSIEPAKVKMSPTGAGTYTGVNLRHDLAWLDERRSKWEAPTIANILWQLIERQAAKRHQHWQQEQHCYRLCSCKQQREVSDWAREWRIDAPALRLPLAKGEQVFGAIRMDIRTEATLASMPRCPLQHGGTLRSSCACGSAKAH